MSLFREVTMGLFSGGFSPSQLSGLGYWREARSGENTEAAGTVSLYKDLVGSADFAQATGTKQPAISALPQSGKKAYKGDGTDDDMTATLFTPATGAFTVAWLGHMVGDRVISLPFASAAGTNNLAINAGPLISYQGTAISNNLGATYNDKDVAMVVTRDGADVCHAYIALYASATGFTDVTIAVPPAVATDGAYDRIWRTGAGTFSSDYEAAAILWTAEHRTAAELQAIFDYFKSF